MNAVANRTERRAQEQNWFTPEVNIFENKDGYVLQVDMPGVNKSGLEITLEGNTLTIIGRKNEPESGANPVYRESGDGGFRRVFELDPAIDTARINAKVEQGILTLHLPKAEKVKPRKIQVGD